MAEKSAGWAVEPRGCRGPCGTRWRTVRSADAKTGSTTDHRCMIPRKDAHVKYAILKRPSEALGSSSHDQPDYACAAAPAPRGSRCRRAWRTSRPSAGRGGPSASGRERRAPVIPTGGGGGAGGRELLPHHLTPVAEGAGSPIPNPQRFRWLPWSGRSDSNRRPSAPKADALPTALRPGALLAVTSRLSPVTVAHGSHRCTSV